MGWRPIFGSLVILIAAPAPFAGRSLGGFALLNLLVRNSHETAELEAPERTGNDQVVKRSGLWCDHTKHHADRCGLFRGRLRGCPR